MSHEETDKSHIFKIADNGIGIDPIYHEEVFSMSKRLHTKSEFTGTGMGLETVKKIVHKLNDYIELNSEVGKGSEFLITLSKL